MHGKKNAEILAPTLDIEASYCHGTCVPYTDQSDHRLFPGVWKSKFASEVWSKIK